MGQLGGVGERQQYHADYYSGANVTIAIGPCILTQVAGVQFGVQQSKRPIYGYNSQYFDAVAKGQVSVSGNLWINFVNPRYLTVTIHRFYTMVYAFLNALSSGNSDGIQQLVNNNPSYRDIFRAMSRRLDLPQSAFNLDDGEYLDVEEDDAYQYQLRVEGGDINTGDTFQRVGHMSRSRATANEQDFSRMLDEIFEDSYNVSGLQNLVWGENVTGVGGTPELRSNAPALEENFSIAELAATSGSILGSLSSFARADQMGHPSDGYLGIDITIMYGNPYDDPVTDLTLQYDTPSSIVIKDVHFLGQSQEITTEGNALIEVYPFMARNIHLDTSTYHSPVSYS